MELATILLVDNPGALLMDDGSAASFAAFNHIPLNRSSESPTSCNDTESCLGSNITGFEVPSPGVEHR